MRHCPNCSAELEEIRNHPTLADVDVCHTCCVGWPPSRIHTTLKCHCCGHQTGWFHAPGVSYQACSNPGCYQYGRGLGRQKA